MTTKSGRPNPPKNSFDAVNVIVTQLSLMKDDHK